MEWLGIKTGFWGENGGHILRLEFLKETKRQGYSFVSSYVHRNVIQHRINRGEDIEIIQKYDPDKLDYYRYDLSSQNYLTTRNYYVTSFSPQVLAESTNVKRQEETQIDKNYPIID